MVSCTVVVAQIVDITIDRTAGPGATFVSGRQTSGASHRLADTVRWEIWPEAVSRERGLGDRESPVRGHTDAAQVALGTSLLLARHGAPSTIAFKRRGIAGLRGGVHAQIRYNWLDDSCRARAKIRNLLDRGGWAPVRCAICLNGSMGHPRIGTPGRATHASCSSRRKIFAALRAMEPVAPLYGDFALSIPLVAENPAAAIAAGASTTSQLWRCFTVRPPHENDDIAVTLSAVEVLRLIGTPEVEMPLHSNCHDGQAARPDGTVSTFGFALVEVHIVKGLFGLKLSHCFGHTFRAGETARISHRARRGPPDARQHTVRQHHDHPHQVSDELRRAGESCARDCALAAPTQQRGSGDAGAGHGGAAPSRPSRTWWPRACRHSRRTSRAPIPSVAPSASRSGSSTEPRRQHRWLGRAAAGIAPTRLGATGALVRRVAGRPRSASAQHCPDGRLSAARSTRLWRQDRERCLRVSAQKRDSLAWSHALPEHRGDAA